MVLQSGSVVYAPKGGSVASFMSMMVHRIPQQQQVWLVVPRQCARGLSVILLHRPARTAVVDVAASRLHAAAVVAVALLHAGAVVAVALLHAGAVVAVALLHADVVAVVIWHAAGVAVTELVLPAESGPHRLLAQTAAVAVGCEHVAVE